MPRELEHETMRHMGWDQSRLLDAFEAKFGDTDGCRFQGAPYRLSPLGAHTDHQGGLTSGFTLAAGVHWVFRGRQDGEVLVHALDFPGSTGFSVTEVPGPLGDWGDYPRGIARELARHHVLRVGLEGVVVGDLAPGGISSSAALQVSFLFALAAANEIRLAATAALDLVVLAERNYAGVAVGYLDPAVILNGGPETLVVLDAADLTIRRHRLGRSASKIEWLLVDCGLPRDLRASPYNARVAECAEAARVLGDTSPNPRLSAVPPEAFRRRAPTMDPMLRRRAEHYFSEHKRVKQGVQLWTRGDMGSFGLLMTASGASLTRNFDCGTPETTALLSDLLQAPGVLGASYAGGGFGGFLQALATTGAGDLLARHGFPRYSAAFPDAATRLRVVPVIPGPGLRV